MRKQEYIWRRRNSRREATKEDIDSLEKIKHGFYEEVAGLIQP